MIAKYMDLGNVELERSIHEVFGGVTKKRGASPLLVIPHYDGYGHLKV